MNTLYVELGNTRRYPIIIKKDLLKTKGLLTEYIQSDQLCIITNKLVSKLYLSLLKPHINHYKHTVLELPDGEQHKNLETLDHVITHLIENKHRRNTTMIALGGGVIGDITGFAAACYQRGVSFIQIPTTLLAQVDSSVGGKTAVNHPKGKNMIGSFHQPAAVLIDPQVLLTLPCREYRAGLAEVIKYGLIADSSFFEFIEKNIDGILMKQLDTIEEMILRSCQIKAEIVAQDEYDHGIRAILNFGHTFGHAIEAMTNYEEFLHGEAVAQGMIFEAQLSKENNLISADECDRIQALIDRCGLPLPQYNEKQLEKLVEIMQYDKKNTSCEAINVVLLEKIGKAKVYQLDPFFFLRYC